MTEKEIKYYQQTNPVYYPTVPQLKTKCPVNYDYGKCSSKEYKMCCRTCVSYNPLRMLYEKEFNQGNLELSIPIEILLADAEIQLKH